MMYKGIKLRIYPTKEQQNIIKQSFGACRFVWNQMLNMSKERYENNKDSKWQTGFDMNILLKQLKEEYPWLKQINAQSLQDQCESLAKAYQRAFKHTSGFPKFKSKRYAKQSYKLKQINNDKVTTKSLYLPGLKTMKYRGGNLQGKIKSATIELKPTGKYYCVLLVECESQAQLTKTEKQVGIDLGVSDLVITSDSKVYKTIRFDKRLAKKKHYWEKRLARRRAQAQNVIASKKQDKSLLVPELNDFKNYTYAKQMVAKYSEKVANQRKDYLHKITTELVKDYDVIVMEDLKTKNMIKNHNLASAIANQSWRELRDMLQYKCDWYGKKLVLVSPRNTSRTCHNCGAYNEAFREMEQNEWLAIRQWDCPTCGAHLDRDVNASQNILKLGLG